MSALRCVILMLVGLVVLSSRTCYAEVYMQDTLVVSADRLPAAMTALGDTVITPAMTDTIAVSVKKSPDRLDSKMALLFSIIPGGGQIYNRQYWKLPIVVGAYTACYYAINWNNTALTEYSNAYRDIMSDRPMENTRWQDFIPYGADPAQYVSNTSFQNQLRRGRDFYRRYRDLSIIITAGVYLLVMVDAYVDAELSNFDISPSLTMQASPTVILPNPSTPTPQATGLGLHLAFTF